MTKDQKQMMRVGAHIINNDVNDLQKENLSAADRAIIADKLRTAVNTYIEQCLEFFENDWTGGD